MPKIAKYVAIAVCAVIGLLLIVIGIVAATFNPNDYKPLVIKLVQEKKQRTLAIPGAIKLTFFPTIGADLGRISLSEHNSSAEFAAMNSAKVSLALWPLLSKRVVVDRITIDGLSAHLKRFKDGSTSIDDLLSKEESGEQIKFKIDSVHVTNAQLRFDDQQQNRQVEVTNANLDSGQIANGVPSKIILTAAIKSNQPNVAIQLAVKTGFTFDTDKKHYVLKGLDAAIDGALAGYTDVTVKAAGDADIQAASDQFALDGIALSVHAKQAGQTIDAKFDVPKLSVTRDKVAGGKLNGEAKLTEGARTIIARFSAPSFTGSPQAFKIPELALNANIKDAGLDATAKVLGTISGDIDKLLFSSPQIVVSLDGKQGDRAISGTLTTPFVANFKTHIIELAKIAAAFSLPNPGGGSLKLKADGQASVNLDKKTAAATLKGNLDQSAFDAKLGIVSFSPMAFTFDAAIDQLDVDRYQAKSAAAATVKAGPEKPIDLSALKTLNAKGSLRIGALKVENIKASNVRIDLHAADGKLDVNPLAANLYGGSMAGSLTMTASGTPHLALRQNLTGINVGPLLKDALDKQPIDGKGNVKLDITAQGALVSQMKKSLAGSAQLDLRDGALHGINIAQTIREAKARLGALSGNPAPQTGTSAAGEKTDFSELKGSFRIANGIAHNDDLSAKSPLIRLGGNGDINIADERLDYVAKATVVSTLQGQGGPELQALKGVTIPVKLSGPFTSIGWKVDFGGMVNELAKQKIDEKKEEVKAKVQEQVQEKLKEGLKGLFGK